LVDSSAAVKEVIGSLDGVEILLRLMRAHPMNPMVLGMACAGLRSLSAFAANKTRYLERGGVPLLVGTMRAHESSVALQIAACNLIRVLADDSTELQQALAEAGAVATVLAALRTSHSPSIVSAHRAACGALRSLANDSSSIQKQFLRGGALDLLIDQMKASAGVPSMQAEACNTLCSLVDDDSEKRSVVEKGGVDLVIQAMHAHSNNAEVQTHSCRLLWTLAVHAPFREVIGQRDGVFLVLSAMEAHVAHAALQQSACGALRLLLCDNESNRARFAECRGEAIVSRSAGMSHAGVQRQAQLLLRMLQGVNHSDDREPK